MAQGTALFSNNSYFFFNEISLQSMFRRRRLTQQPHGQHQRPGPGSGKYAVAKYGPEYADIRFPSARWPTAIADPSNAAAFHVVLDGSATNRAVLTTDPDHWAKWWEWRQVVFANLMAGYARQLADLNRTNAYWRGAIHFIPPSAAWTPRSGIRLDLLAKITGLDWMVVENNRGYTYGGSPAPDRRGSAAATARNEIRRRDQRRVRQFS
jgi:hypothetical protein